MTYNKGDKLYLDSEEEAKVFYLSFLMDYGDNVHLFFRQWCWNTDDYVNTNGAYACISYQTKLADGNWPEDAQMLVYPPFAGYSNYYHKTDIDRFGRVFLFYEYCSSNYDPDVDYFPALLMHDVDANTWCLPSTEDMDILAFNHIKNGSFESWATVGGTGYIVGDDADNWTFVAGSSEDVTDFRVVGGYSPFYFLLTEGYFYTALKNYGSGNAQLSWFGQTLLPLTIGEIYDVYFDVVLDSESQSSAKINYLLSIGDTLVKDGSVTGDD